MSIKQRCFFCLFPHLRRVTFVSRLARYFFRFSLDDFVHFITCELRMPCYGNEIQDIEERKGKPLLHWHSLPWRFFDLLPFYWIGMSQLLLHPVCRVLAAVVIIQTRIFFCHNPMFDPQHNPWLYKDRTECSSLMSERRAGSFSCWLFFPVQSMFYVLLKGLIVTESMFVIESDVRWETFLAFRPSMAFTHTRRL